MLRGCAAAIDAKSVKTMLAASIGTSHVTPPLDTSRLRLGCSATESTPSREYNLSLIRIDSLAVPAPASPDAFRTRLPRLGPTQQSDAITA